MRMKINHAITSARRTLPVCFDRHAGRYHYLEEVELLATELLRFRLEMTPRRWGGDSCAEDKFRRFGRIEVPTHLRARRVESSCKLDQAKHVSSSLQFESGHETWRSILEQGECAFLARSTPDHNSDPFTKLREMINNLITQWLVWHWTDNAHTGKDRNCGEAPRYCGRAQGFDGEFGNGSGGTLRPVVPTSTGSIQCDFHHPSWGDGDKRRGHQGCAGRSIEPDAGNSDSDGFLCQEFLCFDHMFRWTQVYNGNQVGGTNVFNSLQVI